ncbi:hypothetical protein M0L20_03555 [Spirosoma sp. RP8]|uniref:Uncharacterized protein n=1 Tax=Spirosoma liriopis TaxID=2937440 RepID=A0ABT0HGU9_9BACT|nr:hypothetical protein [Spirosoma liriopis]MCK8490913.1 hypothetical protein [Spirosoma liriopis]
MMLFINGTSRGIQCSNLGYWVKDYESAFETLTQLVAEQWTLQEATIVDEHNRMSIPVEAFDGQPIQVHIHTLQQQWNRILFAKPELLELSDEQWLKNHFTQLDTYYKDMLTHLEKMIVLYEIRKTKLNVMRDKDLRTRVRAQYDLLLEGNKRMYKQIRNSRQKNQIRLNRFDKET